jgi:hypothetical protein
MPLIPTLDNRTGRENHYYLERLEGRLCILELVHPWGGYPDYRRTFIK